MVTRWLVVGGGTAGCVVASRLSEHSSHHVTLLEAGGRSPGTRSPSYLDELDIPGRTWAGEYPIGRGLGGSSVVNGGLLTGELHRLGETRLDAHCAADADLGPVDRALLASAPDAERAMLVMWGGRRSDTAALYLSKAADRPNLDIVTDSVVDRITFDRRVAVGVVGTDGLSWPADRVVITAGAVLSPALLLRSGVDTPGVGDGLADHPGRVIELMMRNGADIDPHSVVTAATLRRGGIEIVPMNHLGPGRPGVGALLAGRLDISRGGRVGLDEAGDPRVELDALTVRQSVALDEAEELGLALLRSPAFDAVESFHVVPGGGRYAHAASSCGRGRVVDDIGALRGYDGVFVADASALPALPDSGLYLPVVLQAERLVRAWVADD